MKSIVKGVHVDLTRSLKAHVQSHLVDKIAGFYDDEAAEIEIHLRDSNGDKGGLDKECSVTLRMPGLVAVHVTEQTEDIYKSIDNVRDRLERAVKRELARRREAVVRPSRGAYRPEEGAPMEDIDG